MFSVDNMIHAHLHQPMLLHSHTQTWPSMAAGSRWWGCPLTTATIEFPVSLFITLKLFSDSKVENISDQKSS